MAHGLKSFKDWFKGYEQNYVVIGGTACELLMEFLSLMLNILSCLRLKHGKICWIEEQRKRSM